MATDPVCKMKVDERSAKFKANHQGTVYYFCSEGCMKSFNANPSKYAK
jgi:YHS domain-containing protein